MFVMKSKLLTNKMKNLPFTKYPLSGGSVPCPICGSNKRIIISKYDRRFKILPHSKCDECALIRHEFMLSDEQLDDYYSNSYRLDYQRVVFGPSSKHIKKRVLEAKTRLINLNPHLRKGSRVLDFGCGSGEFLEIIQDKGVSAQGFEPGSLYAGYAKNQKGLNVQNSGWQAYHCKDKFDIITSFHVFEHLTDPLNAFNEAVKWLKPKGLIYIEVPNMANSLSLKGFGSLHMAHTIGFGRYNLELLGAYNGMVPLKVFDDFDIGIIFQKGNPRPLKEIKKNSIEEFKLINKNLVNKQFFRYSFSKLFRKRFNLKVF